MSTLGWPSSISLPSIPRCCQSVSVEGNKVVSTVTLQATAEVMKDGVTCEVSNEHGTDSKTLLVSLKRGQCQEMTATMKLVCLPPSFPFMCSSLHGFWCLVVMQRCVLVRSLKIWFDETSCIGSRWNRFLLNLFRKIWFEQTKNWSQLHQLFVSSQPVN